MSVPRDPRTLPDWMLPPEITHARHALARADLDRRERKNPSDAGALALDEAVAQAEGYLALCLAELDRRKASGRFTPVRPPAAKTVVVKPRRPAKTGTPAPLPRSVSSDPVDAEEPEDVPIVVFDGGVPRRWRKGDPIY